MMGHFSLIAFQDLFVWKLRMASYRIPQMHTWVMSANTSDNRPMFGQVLPQEIFFSKYILLQN